METIVTSELQGPLEFIEQAMADEGQTSGFNDTYTDVVQRSHGDLIVLGSKVREFAQNNAGFHARVEARIEAYERGY